MTIRSVSGRILRQLDHSPLRDTLIQVWDRDFGLDDLLGSGLTNDDGAFSIQYDTEDAGDKPDLSIKVIRLDGTGSRQTIEQFDGPREIDRDYVFPDIEISGWEYDPDFRVPLVYSDGDGIASSPENFEGPQVARILFHGATKGVARKLAEREGNMDDVQEHFEQSLTQRMEQENPGSSRSDEFLVASILNGFNPAKLSFSADDDTYHLRYDIDAYDVDDVHQSPSVHLRLIKNAQDNLVPESITYRIRDRGANSATFGPETSATPGGDPDEWKRAKELFRIAEAVDGQVKGHLGRGHLNTGQFAVAFYRNFQKSPIVKLLHPHLKSVSAINTFGKGIIFGKEGILVQSPLRVDSLVECMRDDLGDCDWRDWSPRPEVDERHSYARIQKLYWDVLNEHIESFFEMHLDKIKKDWKEVFYFSQDLVDHSVPYFAYELPEGETWVSENEVSPIRAPGTPSMSSITTSKTNPTGAEIEQLKHACGYAIYNATIWHDWRNDNQRNYSGEIEYARLAIDYSVEEAAFQLFIVNLLVDVKYGYLSKNEDEDIPANFVYLLKLSLEKFADEGYDLRDLRSRINI